MQLSRYETLFSTFSIVARDAETGQLGVAVQTHQMCVGAIVPWLLPGVGAVATQSLVNVAFGPMGLAMLQEGVPAPRVVEALVATDEGANRRQLAVVDAEGRAAAWTGDGCIAYAAHHTGEGYSVQANMMDTDRVVPAMAEAFEAAQGAASTGSAQGLAQRMMAALHAAQREGGDIRGMQSAALRVVSGEKGAQGFAATVYDLRVDESARPLDDLDRLVRLRNAQLIDRQGYRALHEEGIDRALEIWAQARAQAPELEELGYWQALTLADEHGEVEKAARILREVFDQDPRRAQWIDLIRRLQACGLIERAEAGEELIVAIK
ncbi:MAG: DUF1028 domain-containing protein [Anaerolineae bacterium]|nr:DUF1028 domain-containing protein [Anaerolineae bacterium]